MGEVRRRCPVVWWVGAGAMAPEWIGRGGWTAPRKFSVPAPPTTELAGTGTVLTGCRWDGDLDVRDRRWSVVGDGLAVGVVEGDGPRPDEVARDDVIVGHEVALGGHGWMVPVARLLGGSTRLPRQRVFRGPGELGWMVAAPWEDLWREAGRWFDARFAGDPEAAKGLQDEDMDRLTGAAVAVNYRLGFPELVALGWLTDVAQVAVLDALVDGPVILKLARELAEGKDGAGDGA